MKKLFLFATIAAAGLFASCSSTDDAIGNAANNGIEGAESDAPAIHVGIGNIAQMATRGTGTVGGVTGFTTTDYANLGALANKWAGQHINVFMFTKGALDNDGNIIENREYETTFNLTNIGTTDAPEYLYNNTEMVTPGSTENWIPGMGATANTNSDEAMIATGKIQYYPLSGNFDFFGYHLDDALDNTRASAIDADTRPIDKTATDKWTVPFEIDGSQDLMSTKAALTAEYTDPNDPTSAVTGGQKFIMNNSNRPDDYYSAYAARREVQPILSFNHLLTRFAFFVKAGNVNAAGYSPVLFDTNGADTWNMTGANVEGAKQANGQLDATEAANYNATLPGALPIDGTTGLTEAQANAYNATLNGAVSTQTVGIFSFTAHPSAESDVVWANGKAMQISQDAGWTVIKVVKNSVEGWVGREFAVNATDLGSGTFELKNNDAGHTALDPTVWVKGVAESTLTAEEAIAYNATLEGHATAGQPLAENNAKTYNEDLQGALSANTNLSEDEAKLYNRTLSGAKHAGDVNPNVEGQTDPAKAVKVTRIMVKSKAKGDMAVAWKGEAANLADEAKINWSDAEAAELTLKARAAYKKTSADAAALTDLAAYATLVAELETLTQARDAIQDQSSEAYITAAAAVTAKQEEINDLDLSVVANLISANTFTNILSDAGRQKYTALTAQEALNEKLIALSPTPAKWSGEEAELNPVGEALLVGPTDRDDKSYYLEVDVTQDLRTNWNDTETRPYPVTSKLLIKVPDQDGWKINTSYNIILTVYSLERIEVMTVITPWDEYEDNLNVGGDDL